MNLFKNVKVSVALFERMYQQWRIAQTDKGWDDVDIIASKQHADSFHKMLSVKSAGETGGPPVVIRWSVGPLMVLGMTERTYRSEDIRFPPCTLHVLIPNDRRFKNMFSLMHYQSGGYFDFITMREYKLPAQINHEQRGS